MIVYDYESLFLEDSILKEIKIIGDGVLITNSEINSENFSLEEILISGRDLIFGECNSAKIAFSVGYYDNSIEGKIINVSITPDGGTEFDYGQYKILSDKPTADKQWRDIIAYDLLYDILKLDVLSWFNSVLPDENSSLTLKQFRDSFFSYVNLSQEVIELPNDDIIVKRTINPTALSGKQVLNSICEINGCFGRIGRDGQFKYIFLTEPQRGIFPANNLYPTSNIYPQNYGFGDSIVEDGKYLDLKYEDYVTRKIDKLQILNNENEIGYEEGTGNNIYAVKDNFLCFDRTDAELEEISGNMYGVIKDVYYQPCEMQMLGDPCIEVGDGVQIVTTDNVTLASYVFKRKLTGIQSLKDKVSADGNEKRENDINSTKEQIVQVKGNIRKVEADVVETNLLIAREIQADRARIGDLEADHVSVQDLEATNARVGYLEADHVSVQELNAVDAKFQNLNASNITAGTLSVDRLNINALLLSFEGKAIGCSDLIAGTVKAVNTLLLREASAPVYHSTFLNTLTIDGITFNYVGWS